jgi:hypothetical protein
MTEQEQPEQEPAATWVRTEPVPGGTGYMVVVEVGDDVSRALTPQLATDFASHLHRVAAIAEYEAAVLAQLTRGLKLPKSAAVQVILDMRADRPETRPGTWPLDLVPGVAIRDGSPFISVALPHRKKPFGQWDPDSARRVAGHLLEAIAAADLDLAYHRELVGAVGVTAEVAGQVIDDLAKWRPVDDDPRAPSPVEGRLRALVSDWQANGGSRALGDHSDRAWHDAARQLLAVLDGGEPS